MSRPFRLRFALCLAAFSVGFSGCSSLYRPVYSNRKNYFQPPSQLEDKKTHLTAEEVLKATDAQGLPETPAAPDNGNLPPAAPPAAPDAPATPPATPPPN